MRDPQVILERDGWCKLELLGAEQAEEILGVKRAAFMMVLALGEHADAEIEAAGVELVKHGDAADRAEPQGDSGGRRPEPRKKRWYHRHLDRIGQPDAENPLRRRRVEVLALE